ncbi:hypothetical protein [Lentzea terrae]|uniref:hypothetical protein n=1 Tax=Lentzea terrae TaxID=2200761 RepID=UPI0018E54730|nr:hypothetical protein [Lentzea terrae]
MAEIPPDFLGRIRSALGVPGPLVLLETDLNYQVTVGRDGAVHLDFAKEAITEGGMHKGHRIPARLSRAQAAELAEVAAVDAGRLRPGDRYLMTSVGLGATFSAMVLKH